MLSDSFPTGYEVGTLAGKVAPGGTVVIIGVGPIGVASLITAQWLSPSIIVAVDNDEGRLRAAKAMGATHTATAATALEVVKAATDGKGCDTVIEAVGIPPTFALAQKLLAVGGTLANVGVHGTKVELFLDELWSHNITIKTSLVDTVSAPMLLGLVKSGKLDPGKLVTHSKALSTHHSETNWHQLTIFCDAEFKFEEIEKAYETFGNAAKHECLKVLIEMD